MAKVLHVLNLKKLATELYIRPAVQETSLSHQLERWLRKFL